VPGWRDSPEKVCEGTMKRSREAATQVVQGRVGRNGKQKKKKTNEPRTGSPWSPSCYERLGEEKKREDVRATHKGRKTTEKDNSDPHISVASKLHRRSKNP